MVQGEQGLKGAVIITGCSGDVRSGGVSHHELSRDNKSLASDESDIAAVQS